VTTLTLVDTSAPAAKVDHLAEAEARRVEMCIEWDAKISALKVQVADILREAREKRTAAQQLDAPIPHGGGGNHEGAQELYRQVEALVQRVRQIERVDIPALLSERETICSGTHPEISLLTRNALARVAADRDAANRTLVDAHDQAHHEFSRHLLSLATPKTFELARNLETASRAVKRTPTWAVRLLLTDREVVSS
jgi:hypothetical protein